jgi:hypothetical protein
MEVQLYSPALPAPVLVSRLFLRASLKEVVPLAVRINTSGFLVALLVLHLLDEPKIDVAI